MTPSQLLGATMIAGPPEPSIPPSGPRRATSRRELRLDEPRLALRALRRRLLRRRARRARPRSHRLARREP